MLYINFDCHLIVCFFFLSTYSHTIDESPNSDIKMDISETTTSQESPITSPDFEIESSAADVAHVPNVGKGVIPKTIGREKNEILTSRTKVSVTSSSPKMVDKTTVERVFDSLTNDAASLTELLKDNSDLDNRNSSVDCEANLQDRNASNLLNRSGLTLASSHPLMSPLTSGNSDADQIQFNYPDVVPENKPLRIEANPDAQSTIVRDDFSPKNLRDNSVDVLPSNDGVVEQPHTFLSSGEDSEPDSQYQASVEPCFKSVALMATSSISKLRLDDSPKGDTRRKIPVSNDLLSGGDDGSSIETVSNQSCDDDRLDDDFDEYLVGPRNDNHLISASVSSSLMDDGDPNCVTGLAISTSRCSMGRETAGISLSATDEAKDSRGWQKITLPDGRTRDIDMKVIEPYKRVLSHGGYLKAGGHNAIVVFSACYLPDRSRTDYHYVMDNLFYYVVNTLEQLVTEDYVLIYLHGGSTRSNVPSFPWLKKCYQLLDRRLRKSLKNLFMVHPSIWLKSIVWMARPFIRYDRKISLLLCIMKIQQFNRNIISFAYSSKFWRKVVRKLVF